jgi:methanogenic corrinoid protein MtbC1
LILALVEMDEVLFHKTLSDLVQSVGLFNTFLDYLIPFLDRIGIMWLVGSINTAQEHFISHLIRQRVIAETDKLDIPSKTEAPIMLFLPEHEWHEISLLFYQYILRKNGINTVYLGQSLPFDSLVECIDKIQPKAILTSWLTSVDEKFLVNYFKNLGREAKSIKIYAGGYQIGKHSEALKDMVHQINDIKVLSKLFTI